jgi:tetratricopeptide (TPR) repeat protein
MNSYSRFIKVIFIFVTFLFIITSHSQVKSKGLVFASSEQLRAIPVASSPYSGDEMPNSADLSEYMPPPGNQGMQNSCVAWALAYAVKSYQEKVEERVPFYSGDKVDNNRVFSPSYIYNQMNNGRDGGSSFIFSMNLLSDQGCVPMSVMQYNSSDYLTLPTDEMKEIAKKYKIDYWRQVNFLDPQEVKAQINAGYPVLIGASVDKGFEEKGHGAVNPYIWNSYTNNETSGHAMVVVGFDDHIKAFKIMNSWGKEWGNDGFCWISYEFFPVCVHEAYVLKDAMNSKSPNITSTNSLLIDGINALSKDEYITAIDKFSEYLKIKPDSDTAYNFRGLSYFKLGDLTNSLSDLNNAVKINPDYAAAFNNRGNTYYKSGLYADAINDFNKVITIDPNFASSYFFRGLAYNKVNNYREAVKDLSVAIDIKPDNPNTYYNRGIAYFELKEYEKAMQDFSKSIMYNPKVSIFYLKKGISNYKLKNYSNAIDDYKKAIEINPDNFDANKELGLSYYQDNNFSQSIKYLSDAINLDNSDVICFYVRGLCYYLTASYDNAVRDWENAINLDSAIESKVKDKLDNARKIVNTK